MASSYREVVVPAGAETNEELHTERLRLIPLRLWYCYSLLRGKAAFENYTQLSTPPDWPSQDFLGLVSALRGLLVEDPGHAAWVRLVIRFEDDMVLGDIGFHGPPDDEGIVELGFSLVEAARGQGYATEMVTAMVEWALAQDGVKAVLACSLPDNQESQNVLQKVGFTHVGMADDAMVWRRER